MDRKGICEVLDRNRKKLWTGILLTVLRFCVQI